MRAGQLSRRGRQHGLSNGLRTERLAKEILSVAKTFGLPFERVAGWGADPKMLGAGAEHDLPVLVSVPQLIGGGGVGLAIGDSLSITERCSRMAKMIDDGAILIESAIALTQEIHDGPFETFTGHAFGQIGTVARPRVWRERA